MPVSQRLTETEHFGRNPGGLRMLSFVPENLPAGAPLVVVLHGCTQTAEAYDEGSGWSALAEQRGFALLYPEQQRSNNPNLCFNWFNPADTARGSGEARSIRMMIDTMVRTHALDSRRVFVTGLSAGGAMASVMLATYPEVFSAGAIIAGLPFGVAANLREALTAMSAAPSRSATELGARVRNASPHKGPSPRLSVWHGDADRTVHPGNAGEIVKQWLDLHGLPAVPMASTDVNGHVREQWWNREGRTIVESYTIRAMPHGTPLAIEGEQEGFGVAGPFMLDVGISSTLQIAEFFGLKEIGFRAAASSRGNGDRHTKPKPETQHRDPAPRPLLEVGQVIQRALSAAGLLK